MAIERSSCVCVERHKYRLETKSSINIDLGACFYNQIGNMAMTHGYMVDSHSEIVICQPDLLLLGQLSINLASMQGYFGGARLRTNAY